MAEPIKNMRITFYGVQGSASTFPASHEIDALQEFMDCQLLEKVFEDLARHLHSANQFDRELASLLGGPVSRKTLLQYRQKFKIPKPRMYGGWTTCIHVKAADGYDIVFDCGSGFRNCARDLQAEWGERSERELHIFGSHSHYDHTEGFDQAAVCFDPRNRITIYGNYQFLYALDIYLGILSKFVPKEVLGLQTPINYLQMPASFQGIEIRDASKPFSIKTEDRMKREVIDLGKPIVLGGTTITAFEVYHPAPCLAYKIEHGGKKFVFCTDHELRLGSDPGHPGQKASEEAEARLMVNTMDADVLYRDGQYLHSDYKGLSGIGLSNPVERIDWGHSCIEDVQKMALQCRVKRTFIGHQDPNREWAECNWIDESLARHREGDEGKIELAQSRTVIDL